MATDYTSDANMVAYYMFEDDPGLTKSGTGDNHVDDGGNLPDKDTVNYKEGIQSADFVAANSDNIYAADASLTADFPGIEASDSFSIVAWVQMDDHASRTICSHYIGTNIWRWEANGDGKLWCRLYYSDGGGGHVEGAANTALSEDGSTWHHVAMVLNGTANKIYLYLDGDIDNGEGLAFDHTMKTAENSYFCIGAHAGGGVHMEGRIDELAVLNRALAEAEIEEIIASGLTGGAVAAPTSVLYGPLVGPLGGPI